MANSIFRELKMGKETFLPVSVENNIFKMMWWCEPGGGVPNHIHPHMDEHFTVLEGEVEFTVSGKTGWLKHWCWMARAAHARCSVPILPSSCWHPMKHSGCTGTGATSRRRPG